MRCNVRARTHTRPCMKAQVAISSLQSRCHPLAFLLHLGAQSRNVERRVCRPCACVQRVLFMRMAHACARACVCASVRLPSASVPIDIPIHGHAHVRAYPYNARPFVSHLPLSLALNATDQTPPFCHALLLPICGLGYAILTLALFTGMHIYGHTPMWAYARMGIRIHGAMPPPTSGGSTSA